MNKTSTTKKSAAKTAVKENSFPVVAIGASAGGLEAMMELLSNLPPDTGMAFIYVQHLSPDHKSMLTEILSKKTKMKVQEIDDMDKILPDNVFVIPSDKGIEVTDGHIKLIPRSGGGAAISIDILFSSLAEAQKERVIGIILSGSASDGTEGMKVIKQQGGLTFAQDDSAKFTSMPHAAIAAGTVDFILSPKEIALELARLSKHPFLTPPSGGRGAGVKSGEEDLIDNQNPDLKIIFNQLHKATGVDFSVYKMNTIKRRIIRRMLLNKITNLKEYAKLLTQKNEEIDILYQDLLINVTSFFRDTDTHQYLKENLLPILLKRKKRGESLRIWVPACATGEEAYSIAMMLLEIQESKTTITPIQIFATDLSEKAIIKARIGIYTKQDLETVSPKRIQRFFNKADGGFRVNKAVRDLCVFAPHNILRDPPFSRLDFISCCNLFIYFDTAAQKKAVNTFHYALNNDGFLMLGKSENISQSTHLFTNSNKKYKIFSRKINSVSRLLPELLPRFAQQPVSEKNVPIIKRSKTQQNISVNYVGLDKAIDAVLVSEFMPASVVINHQLEIVQFRGTTNLFLTHPNGKATLNILKWARPEIAFELRNAISKVIKTKHRFRKSGIEFKIDSAVKIISLEIVSLNIDPITIGWDEPLLLIIFTEQEQAETDFLDPASGGRRANSPAKDRRIEKLERELAAAHADALAISQDQEAFTEELQSANEEVVSSNEELQTVNEELETSKEEIQSSNEELTTTNQELRTRNELLNESYTYSETLLLTVPLPLLILDSAARVKSANKAFYQKYNVIEEETEGQRIYDLGNGQWKIPKLRDLLENIIPQNNIFENFEVEHEFESIGKKIMLLSARCIQLSGQQLILLAITDITEVRKLALEKSLKEKEALELQIEAQKKVEEAYKIANDTVRNLFLEAPAIICVHRGPEHVFELSSKIHQQVLGNRDILGKPVRKAMPDLEGSGIYELLDHVYSTGEPFVGNEYPVNIDRGNGKIEEAYFNFVYQPTHNSEGEIDGLLVHGVEVTEQVLAKKQIEAKENQLQNIFLNAPAAIAVFEGSEHKYVLANKAYEKLSHRKAADLLGKNMQDLFPELKGTDTLEIFAKVLETGESFSAPEYALMLDLKNEGVLRQYYFNFSMEPLKNSLGEIYAVMAITYDITEQVEARKQIEDNENQQAFLLKLSDAIKELIDPVDIQLTACRILGEHVKVNRVVYGEVIDEEQIIINNNYVNGVPPIIATLDAEQFGRKVIDAFKCNEKVIISDITTDPAYTEEEKQSFLSLDVVANVGMGLVKGGRWVATFGMHYNAPRTWTATEIWLLEETAERTWAAVERAKAEEALRQSEEKYRTLFTSIDQGYALCEVVRNKEGKGIDYYVLDVNPTYEKQSGLNPEMFLDKTILQLFPAIDKWWIETYVAVVDNQRPVVFEHYFEDTDHWFAIKAYPAEKDRFTVLFSDITERNRREANLVFLADINLDFAPLLTAREVMNHVAEKLANFMHLSRCHFSIIDEEQDRLEVIYEYRSDGKLASVMGVHPISDNLTEEGRRNYSAGKLAVINDTSDSPLLKAPAHVLKELGLGSVVAIPHLEAGRWKFMLTVARAEMSEWRSDEVELLQDLTSRIYTRLERASAEETLRKTEERLRLSTQASDIYWWELDFETNVTLYASNTEQVTGAAPAKTLEENLLLLHPDDRELSAKAFEEAIKNSTDHFNFVVRSIAVPSEIRWLQVTGRIIRDNKKKPVLAVGISQNITERKLFEKELMEANVSAENATKSKQQFLSNMSHEIRTPLNSIIGFANVLLKTELGVEQKEFLQAIKTSGKSLNLLINDILDLAKVDAGKMTFEKQPFEIRKSITSILHSFDLKIKEKNLKLIKEYDSEIPSMLLGDSLRLNQILLNLLSNAVKFTHKGKIKLSVKLLSETAENVRLEFTVNDSGIGIADNKLNSIFNFFEQAELSTSNSYGGTGLGLAIVKQLIEAQGGSISLRSKIGEGSTFSFILPFGKTKIKVEEEIEILKPDAEIKNLRVLVAEDVVLNQLLIKIILSDFGFEYEIVDNGKTAIEKMQTNTYDIILMDLQMPEMNGFDATQYIRKTMKSQIPIIALTADVTTADISKCKEFGMDDYISKPINEILLYNKILGLVKK